MVLIGTETWRFLCWARNRRCIYDMKYYINKDANRTQWYCILLGLLLPLGTVLSLLWTNRMDLRFLYCFIAVYPPVLILNYFSRHLISYAKLSTLTADSYSMFGRKYCSVSLDQTVYFIPFEAYISKTQYKGENRPFIALSNHPFTYYDPTKVVNFIVRYDLHTIVVLPYDDRTKPLLPVEKWIQVV